MRDRVFHRIFSDTTTRMAVAHHDEAAAGAFAEDDLACAECSEDK